MAQVVENENIYFLNSHYREILKIIQDKKIILDCILTDPPYCVSRKHQLGFSNMGRAGMDYGEWDYDFNQTEWIKECLKYLKVGGSIIIFNDWKNLSFLVNELEKNGCAIKDLLRWEKSNPMPRNVNSRYVGDCEFAIWAVKGKGKWTFNKSGKESYLKPIFKSGVVPGGKNRLHPTQKHLSVFEDILKIHTNESDLIFDPFSGSATTAIACLNLNRKFIGSEIDKEYFNKAKKRIYDSFSLELSR
ncbi:MAG: site-specific DNA-methyltransferase [Campylobacter sp.]|nr:site-specific DNA-methyltransferase [Campylobacter sp.]